MDEHLLPIDPDAAIAPPTRRGQRDVLAVIAAGGMIGATARYGLARWHPVTAGRFPWATFATNLTGSFLLGFVLMVLIERRPTSRLLRPFLGTGIIGAYTTMSTYEVESALLVKGGRAIVALVYLVVSLAGGVALAAGGIYAGRLAAMTSQAPEAAS